VGAELTVDDADGRAHIALYLCLDEPLQELAESGPLQEFSQLCARETQFELQVLQPDKSSQRSDPGAIVGVAKIWPVKHVIFSSELRSWGHPKLHELNALREQGCVGDDDTLHLAVHVRVRNGRGRCPDAPLHTFTPADPQRTYARYGGSWHCDACHKSGRPGDPMLHCSRGCEYDLCKSCYAARTRTDSLRSRARKREVCIEKSLPSRPA